MRANNLIISPVVFDEIDHTYKLGELYLSGITGMLSRQLFQGKYDGIPEHIMERAREKGKSIHSEIEMYNNGFTPSDPSPEFMAFMMLDLHVIASEYIVSDEKHFATPIDIVDDRVILYDIKTTYKLDKEYCAWQLSICAYLFELQNPTLKAQGISAIWLRDGKAEVVPLVRKPDEDVRRLLVCELYGEKFQPSPLDIAISDDDLLTIKNAEAEIINIKKSLEEAEAKATELKKVLLKLMIENGVDKYEGEGVTLTVKRGYERTSLDSSKIKNEMPEVYKKYGKTTNVKPTLTININDNEI